MFIGAQLIYYAVSAIAGCSWNSWIRDFVPEKLMGGYFAKRMAWCTALGAAVSMVAGILAGRFEASMGITIYCLIIGAGTVFGFISSGFLSMVPEPKMKPSASTGILATLAEPFKDTNFRMLVIFLGWWSFAMNLSAPFFVVYMLNELKLSMAWIIALSVLSQFVNVFFFRFWGRLADRYSNKSVLMVSGTLFVLSISLWFFMSMPERYFMTIPLLILFHVLAGMSTAGIGLCAGNLALKCAPFGHATAYLAVNALVGGSVAIVAPLIAGAAADWLQTQQLSVTITWALRRHVHSRIVLPAPAVGREGGRGSGRGRRARAGHGGDGQGRPARVQHRRHPPNHALPLRHPQPHTANHGDRHHDHHDHYDDNDNSGPVETSLIVFFCNVGCVPRRSVIAEAGPQPRGSRSLL